jgi:methyl-accepting chemotaxis protein
MKLDFRDSAFRVAFSINLLLLFVTVALGLYSATLIPALTLGIPLTAIPYVLERLSGDSFPARASYGISFMLFAALNIHQGMGFTELHFGIFVLLAVLIVFRDWKVIAVAAATIAVHHIAFMYLQLNDSGVYILPEDKLSINIILLHALYVIIEAVVLGIIAKRTLTEAKVGQAFFDLATGLSNNDGSINIRHRLPEELGSDLLTQFNGVLDKITNSLQVVSDAVDKNTKAVSTVRSQVDSLSQGAREQKNEASSIATATEQMSVSIRETKGRSDDIAASSKKTKENINQASTAINDTQVSVTQLSDLLNTAKTAVSGMSDATNDIKSVLGVIDSIAEQTNLLALNAAIEAARAGESGRGFAVVADEVRQLASKTQDSTKKVEQAMARLSSASEDSVKTVDLCLEQLANTETQSRHAETLLTSINEQTTALDSSIQEITVALEQQSIASTDISESTQRLNELADIGASVSSKTDEQTDRLSDTTQALSAELNRFKL